MLTKLGSEYASVLDANALRQIAHWCDTAQVTLEHASKDGATDKIKRDYLLDADLFYMLSVCINNMLSNQ